MNLPEFLTQDQYGFIRVTGHRIGLHHLVELRKLGYDTEMMHAEYPTLPTELIDKVLAFSLEHQSEVDKYVRQTRQKIDAMATAPQPGPDSAELRRRMDARRTKESA